MRSNAMRSVGVGLLVAYTIPGCRGPKAEPVAPTLPPAEVDRDPDGVAESSEAAAETQADPAEEISSTEAASGSGPEVPASAAVAETVTGIEVCDQYLALYERCEPILRPEIMAGDRRPVHAEKGWFQHLAGTPEKAALPDACQQLLDELRPRCPVPEPSGP